MRLALSSLPVVSYLEYQAMIFMNVGLCMAVEKIKCKVLLVGLETLGFNIVSMTSYSEYE